MTHDFELTPAEQAKVDLIIERRDFEEHRQRVERAWSRVQTHRRLGRGLRALQDAEDTPRTRLTRELLTLVRNTALHFEQSGPVDEWLYCLRELIEKRVIIIGKRLWLQYGAENPNILKEVQAHSALPRGAWHELDFIWDDINELPHFVGHTQ